VAAAQVTPPPRSAMKGASDRRDEGDEPVTSRQVPKLAAEVAERLAPREQEIVRGMSALLSSIEQLDADPRMLDLLEASVAGNINTILNLLRNAIPLEQLQPTTAAVSYAIYLAERGIPINSLIRAYHMGQEDLLEHVYREVGRLDCDDEVRFEVLRYLSRILYQYIDWIVQHVTAVYSEERQRWETTRLSVHTGLVSKLLADRPGAGPALESATGYRLDQYHVAVITWVPDDRPESTGLPVAETFARRLHQRFGRGGVPLIAAIDRTTVWTWIPRGTDSRRIATTEVAATTGSAQLASAVGLPLRGDTGFRRSLEQAELARRVSLASALAHEHLGYGDHGVAVITRLAEDLPATREWVGFVLGGLAAETADAERLRETLRVFLGYGSSYTDTAAALHLHRNSVRYRIENALKLRGRPLGSDRLDVELALQACRLLGASVLTGP
jgi:hypothetical protein